MKIVLTVVWLGLAAAFLVHAVQQFTDADRPPPVMDADPPKFQLSTEGLQVEIDLHGTPLDKPFRDFESQWNDYVAESASSLAGAHRRVAWTSVAGGVACLAALVLLWVRPVGPAPPSD